MPILAEVVHRRGDVQEVFPEFAGDVLVRGVLTREFHGNRQHVEGVHAHPARAIGLFEMCACWERSVAIEDADVVESQESSLKHVHPLGVFSIHPPGEVDQQLVEDALQEPAIAHPPAPLLDLVNAPRRPCVYRRVQVPERPLIRRQLPVGMHVPLAQQQDELILGEI